MSSLTTFGAFTAARLGIYASMKGLQVTGNNIANINTTGYTRQVLNQVSLRTGGHDRYQSIYDADVGSGVLCTGISQIRDPYLDIRYRNEQANVGALDAKMSVLEDLKTILDEVGKGEDEGGILEAQFNDLISQLHVLSKNVGSEDMDSIVRSSAETLVNLLRSYAGNLETTRKDTAADFKQDITTVNGLLGDIRDLNESIRNSEIHGDSALELRDERNLKIDQLSYYMKIDVISERESVGGTDTVERLVIKLAGTGQNNATEQSTLVSGVYATELSVKDDTNYGIVLDALKDSKDRVLAKGKTTTQTVGNPYPVQIDAEREAARLNASSDAISKALNGDVTTRTYAVKTVTEGDPPATTYSVVETTKVTSGEVELKDNDLYGALQSTREMLTEAGEFTTQNVIDNIDPNAIAKRGIPYYQHALDALAQKFAQVMNGANTGHLSDAEGNYVGANGKAVEVTVTWTGAAAGTETLKPKRGEKADWPADYLKSLGAAQNTDGTFKVDREGYYYYLDTDNKQVRIKGEINGTSVELNQNWTPELLDAAKVAKGDKSGALISKSSDGDDTTGITAANISISKGWAGGSTRIQSSNEFDAPSTKSDNIIHLIAQLDTGRFDFKAGDVVADASGGDQTYFSGTLQEMLANMSGIHATDTRVTTTLLNISATRSTERDTNRDSVSGVDLNDEAANLMMYQKTYSAACRVMTTIDEVLDKLINGTGVVGR